MTGNGKLHGVVKWFNSERAYGFISMPDGEMDVFVHAKQLRSSGIFKEPKEGDKVEFNVSMGPKGRYATDISYQNGEAKDA